MYRTKYLHNETCKCPTDLRLRRLRDNRYRSRTKADRQGKPTLYALVDASRAREHYHALRASGWTHLGIAEAIGVSPRSLRFHIVPERERIHRERAMAILSLAPMVEVVDPVVVERLVAGGPAKGASRAERVAAWEALGCTYTTAKSLGLISEHRRRRNAP